jgi:hypothetical protein
VYLWVFSVLGEKSPPKTEKTQYFSPQGVRSAFVQDTSSTSR